MNTYINHFPLVPILQHHSKDAAVKILATLRHIYSSWSNIGLSIYTEIIPSHFGMFS